MNTKEIQKLLSEIGHPPADSKWHIMTSVYLAKKIRSGKHKGEILIDDLSIWIDMNPTVYKKLIKYISKDLDK